MKLIRNTTASMFSSFHSWVSLVKHIQIYQGWSQLSLIRYCSDGNDSSGDMKKPGSKTRHDQSKNTMFQSKLRKPLSPIDRLAGILPAEYQATTLLENNKEYRTGENTNETNKEHDNDRGVYSRRNKSFRNHEHSDPFSQKKWTNPNLEKDLSPDSNEIHAVKDYKLHQWRKRSLSPLHRFSEQIPADFWSEENQDDRSKIETLREIDTKVESKTGLDSETDSFSPVHSHFNSEFKVNEEHVITTLFQFGCLVTLCLNGWSRIPKKYMIKLEKGKTFRVKSYGQLFHDDIEGKIAGQLLTVSPSKIVAITYPTLEEFATLIPRKTVTANPKTINMMISEAGLREGSRVLEAGTGSGATTLFLSRAVGSTGNVTSVEKRSRYSELAQKNINNWWDHCSRLGRRHHPNVTFLNGDVTLPHTFEQYGDLQDLDAVFLDMKNPSEALTNVIKLVTLGGPVMVYCPSMSTVLSCVQKINDNNLPLKVQGVFEDTEALWDIKHLGHSNSQTDMTRMICRPCQCDERKTVFLLKLIKITYKTHQDNEQGVTTDNTAQNTKSCDSNNSRYFIYGDNVLVEYLQLKKDGKGHTYLTRLKENGRLSLPEGHMRHSEVVGLMPGTVVYPQHFPGLIVRRPMLDSYVESFGGTGTGIRHFQHISFVSHSLDVKKGDTILHLGMSSSQCSAYALYLSQAVGKEGNVYCLTGSETEHLECLKNFCTWREIYHQNNMEYHPQNVHFGILDQQEKHFHHLSSLQFDGISADVPLPVLTSNLAFITSRLKSGNQISVFFTSLTSVLHLFHWLRRSDLPLILKAIHEETEREWIVQPVKMNNSTDFHEHDWPYICRPKQNMRKRPGKNLRTQNLKESVVQ